MSTFIPDQWLVSAFEALADYIKVEVDDAVLDSNNVSVGLQAYDVVMSYPEADDLPESAEFSKTIIHFEIDDIDNRKLGFGDSVTKATWVDPVGADPGFITEEEGGWHEINFDVGIWASDQSGGITSRLRAYQMLYDILGTDMARVKCREVTDGVEILRFMNGRFVIEKPNDIRIYRMVGAELVVRVFSRTVADPVAYADQDAEQAPELVIGGDQITD